MRKLIGYETALIIATISIALPLMLSTESYSGHNVIVGENSSRSLTFNLQAGQTVRGSLNYSGDTNGAWFAFTNNQGDELNSSPSEYSREGSLGAFKFVAGNNGLYYLFIWNTRGWSQDVYYQYSVTPSIGGFNPTIIVLIVVFSGVILAIGGALLTIRKKNKNIHD